MNKIEDYIKVEERHSNELSSIILSASIDLKVEHIVDVFKFSRHKEEILKKFKEGSAQQFEMEFLKLLKNNGILGHLMREVDKILHECWQEDMYTPKWRLHEKIKEVLITKEENK